MSGLTVDVIRRQPPSSRTGTNRILRLWFARALTLTALATLTTPVLDAIAAETDTAAIAVDPRTAAITRMNGGPTMVLGSGPLPPTVTEELTVEEAVAFALKNNFEIAAGAQKIKSANWEFYAAAGQFLPTVEVVRNYGKEKSNPAVYNNEKGERVMDSYHNRNDRVYSLRQPLINLKLIADMLYRSESLSAAEAEHLATREKVALETIVAFYKLIQARLTQGMAEEYKNSLDRLTERMSARVAGGGAAEADLDRIKGRATSARSAIIEAKSAFDSALVEFNRLTGVVPAKLAIPPRFVPQIEADPAAVVGRALTGNPDYLVSLRQSDAADAIAARSYSALLPTLSFEIIDSRSYNAGGSAFGQPGDGVYAHQNEMRTMAVVSWTLNGGTDIAQGLADSAKSREMTFRALDIRHRVEEAVRTSHSALTSARSRIGAMREACEANQKVASAFEEQYMTASRPLLDLLDAYERLYQSQVELLRLMIAEAQAGYQLHRQTGDLTRAILGAREDETP